MNRGHGELPFGACPSAKSYPVAENCTDFSVSTPIALDALATTVFASCADAVHTATAASPRTVSHFFSIGHRLSSAFYDASARRDVSFQRPPRLKRKGRRNGFNTETPSN